MSAQSSSFPVLNQLKNGIAGGEELQYFHFIPGKVLGEWLENLSKAKWEFYIFPTTSLQIKLTHRRQKTWKVLDLLHAEKKWGTQYAWD